MVPFNAAFSKTDKVTMVSDVVVEALFILGKCLSSFIYSNLIRKRKLCEKSRKIE